MPQYIVSIDDHKVGNMSGVTLKTWQIERMVRTFAREWGVSPKGVSVESATTVRLKHQGKVR